MRRIFFVVLCLLICGVSASQMRGLNRDFKYTRSGMQDENYPCPSINPACLHSRWNFETAVAGTYTSDVGGFVMTVNGVPVLVDDGTWPHTTGIVGGAQGGAWNFPAGPFLSRADDGSFDMDLVNNPLGAGRNPGDFSVQCVVTPYDVAAGTDAIIAKWLVAGNEMGWWLYRFAATLVFEVSDDGGVAGRTSLATGNLFAAYRPAFITITYNWVTDGTSEMRIYVDNNATIQTNVANGPVFDSAADFTMAASSGGLNPYEGLLQNCPVYKGIVITEAEHDEMFAQWQGRASTFARNVVTTTVSASPPAIPFAPPASGTEPFLIDNPANSFYIGSPAANSGGLYGASDLTSKWWYGSCETCFAAGPRQHCTGWTTSENQGGGAATAVVDCDTTTSAHGGTSIQVTVDGGGMPKFAFIFSACQVNWINQDVTLSLYERTTGGTPSCRLALLEYSDGACATFVVANLLVALHAPPATWTEAGGTVAAAAWNVATNSWRTEIRCDATGTAYTANFDAAMALQAPTTFASDAVCVTDAAADAVCTDTIHSILSPISANGQMSVRGTWRAPFTGASLPASLTIFTDGNDGANNTYAHHVNSGTDEPCWHVIDNAGGQRTVVPNLLNWLPDTDYVVGGRTDGNDGLGLYWNAVWTNGPIGAGTGVRNAAQANSYLCGTETGGVDIWVRNLQFFRRLITW